MLGFWAKAYYATVVVYPLGYWVVKLTKKRPGWLTLALMLVSFIIVPIFWAVAYYYIPIYYLEPFKGRVVESGTGRPIPGSVVIVKYYERFDSMVTVNRFIRAKVTMTNENGDYYIRSEWQLRMGGTPHGEIEIFKPGYSVEGNSNLNFLDTLYWWDFDHRFWNTGHQVYELKKLMTQEERWQNFHKLDIGDINLREFSYLDKLWHEERQYLRYNLSKTNGN